ncbi:hypothetical protein OIDMADRAFT_20084 [Oidiodendron maius Zn]|uniref:Uncharacterized protein n=1 Tax=Oidiodendron maius (strain Zn) TaxID=913774 RepID=A0A0C3D928_OIDMZ|nr:hypothetical protein OIDMADRAFT_20084 [Oidiodendron maius Zn]
MDHHTYAHKLRLEGTGEWLLRKPKFDQWYRAEESSVLWLCGGIGVGKTILVSKVVDHFLSNACYGQSLAYFYCQRGTNEPKRSIPSEILCSIVKQLAFNETTQTLIKPVGNSYDERAKKGFARGSFDIEESTDLILKMSELIPSMIIVIDALDEVDPDRRHELLQAFENICSTASNPVKLFVSSRNDTDIRTMLEGSLNLFIDATDSCGDIETFVVKEVKTVIKRKRLIGGKVSPELENLVVQTLIGRAEGMFRWVQLQIELICNAKHIKRDPDVRSALGKLPATLKESYEQIYSQILELEPPSRVIAERVLSWLLCAKRLLSVHELLAAICVGWDEKPDPVEESDLLDLCFNLVVTDKSSDSFRLAHLSVREYLEMRPEFTTLNTNILAAERCVTTWRMKFPHNDRFYTYSSFYMLEHCQSPSLFIIIR